MFKNKKPISTLEFYNYGENYQMDIIKTSYKVKVSDKEGNIITIEKDDALYACVRLSFDNNSGVLKLLDAAHDDSVLAEIEMPNADYIYNCRFDEEKDAILFDVKSLYGDNTDTIELDVESLVEIYEAGQGIEIGSKSEETGKKPISIKLADGESILQLSESGLSISDNVTTDDELAAAISGKADVTYVQVIADEVGKIKEILGTDEVDPTINEKIDSKADLDEFNDLEEEVGELETAVIELSGNVVDNTEKIGIINGEINDINESIQVLSGKIDDNEVYVYKVTEGLPSNVKEAYIIKNNIGEQLGEQINIYYDSSIISIEYIPESQVLRYKYVDADGVEHTVDIDLSQVVIESEFGDGLKVDNRVVSVKIDETSDSYLSVSENGLKLTGIAEFLAALVDVNNQQWNTINKNRSDLEGVDQQLWTAINNEIQARQQVDSGFQSQLDVEKENRISADTELRNAIDTERAERISGDSAITEGIDDKINAEKERAISSETALNGLISSETTRAEHAESDIIRRLNEEILNRENADSLIRLDLGTSINNLSLRIAGFEGNLSAETFARIEKDEELEEAIGEIRSTYVTKTYVDNKDSEVYRNAVNSAVTESKDYVDVSLDGIEAELKQYSDSGDTILQNAISNNTTRINAITEWDGQGVYDDSGKNGILDVLHREFHEFVEEYEDIGEQVEINTEHIEVLSGKVQTLSTKIDNEKERAIEAESGLSQAISAETQRATEAENSLNTAIDNEVIRAANAENAINDRIDNLILECGIY